MRKIRYTIILATAPNYTLSRSDRRKETETHTPIDGLLFPRSYGKLIEQVHALQVEEDLS